MGQKKRSRNAGVWAMVACITLSLPFSAAAGAADTEPETRVVTTAAEGTVSTAEFFTRLLRDTDAGRPKDGTTRGQYLRILYEAAGAPAVVETNTVQILTDEEYGDAVAWARQMGILLVEDWDLDALITDLQASELLTRALSVLGSTARNIARSVLAAYTGFTQEEDYALPPAHLLSVLARMMDSEETSGFSYDHYTRLPDAVSPPQHTK